jgi:8-oxo-dGTP diphosphatase
MGILSPGDPRRYPKTPRVSAHTIVRKDDRILLIQRGGEPFKGTWAPPGGGIELGETVYDAGKREVFEETGIECEIEGVQEIDDQIYLDSEGKVEVHTVIIRLLARYVGGEAKASSDAADAGWFTVNELDGLLIPEKLREIILRALV